MTLRPRPFVCFLLFFSTAAAPGVSNASPAPVADADKGKKDGDKDGGKKKSPTKADFSVDTSGTTSTIAVKGQGKLSILIKPGDGLKVHPDAPLEIKLKTSNGLRSSKNKLGRGDVVDAKSTAPELACDINANAAGAQTVDAELSFFLCSDSWCQRMKDRVTINVEVTP